MTLRTHCQRYLLALMLTALILPTGCSDDDDPSDPTPSVHGDLVTVWRATSVTVDGTPMTLGEFFEFSPGAVAFNLTIHTDATYIAEELDSATDPADVVDYEEGTAVSSGQTLTLTKTSENGVDLPHPEVVATGTWAVDGFVLTFTMTEDGHTVVLTFSNWLS